MSGDTVQVETWAQGAHTETMTTCKSSTPLLYLTKQSFPILATSATSLQIRAAKDPVREQRKAAQLHSQTLAQRLCSLHCASLAAS